jgi:hypothetical protein
MGSNDFPEDKKNQILTLSILGAARTRQAINQGTVPQTGCFQVVVETTETKVEDFADTAQWNVSWRWSNQKRPI